MEKGKLLNIIMRIAQIITDNCETDEEVEQVRQGIKKYVDFSKSIPQI